MNKLSLGFLCLIVSACAAPRANPKLGVLPDFDHLPCAESIRAKVGDAECSRRLTAFVGRGLRATVVLRQAGSTGPVAAGEQAGAGVVIDAAGRVLTAYHVIRGLNGITATVREVGGADGRFVYRDARVVPMRVVAFAERPDLALLEPEQPVEMPEPLPVDPAVRSFRQNYRYWFFPSRPVAYGGAIVSGLTETAVAADGAARADLVEMNVPAVAGDQGGPVVSYAGNVVGIMLLENTAKKTAYFIPVSIAVQLFGLTCVTEVVR